MNTKNTYDYFIASPSTETVRNVLVQKEGYSSRLLSRIKNEGEVLLNGKPCWFSDFLSPGDVLKVVLPQEMVDTEPVSFPIEIIYEDDQILVVNKDPETVTHPTKRHQEDTLGNYVAHHFLSNGDSAKIRFVNRLDRDTTGIVVIAKNKYVHHYIQSAFGGKAEKTYMAFVHGVPEERRGVISAPIKRVGPEDILRQVALEGKPCVTHYEVVETYDCASLLRLKLETGRTHQIRVHLQSIGHPIIGDPLYCDPLYPNYGMTRQALHAAEMVLSLPQKKGRMIFRAPFKPDMMALWHDFSLKKSNISKY